MYYVCNTVKLKAGSMTFIIDDIHSQIEDLLVKVIQSYQNHEELIPLLDSHDFFGKDALWYMQEFRMHKLVSTNMMDAYINFKWKGRALSNASFETYSSGT